MEVKEIVYQSAAYLGIGRVFPFLKAVNEVLTARGVPLPLEGQATTTTEDPLDAGNQAQVDIFGEGMRGFQNSGPEEAATSTAGWRTTASATTTPGRGWTIRAGDDHLLLPGRPGGCEPQLTSHATANMRIGNDKAFLIQVISQCLPYIGYPRSLNALKCINEAAMG